MTKGKYTKGFTLVELLVVIAIIAILAGALFLVINPAELLKKSRDSRRIADITELNKSISMSLADNKGTLYDYGAGAATESCTGTFAVTPGASPFTNAGWTKMNGTAVGVGGLSEYMSALPADPTNIATNGLCYYFKSSGTAWEINTTLESFSNAGKAINDGGNAGTAATCTAALMPSTSCRYEVGTDPGLDLI